MLPPDARLEEGGREPSGPEFGIRAEPLVISMSATPFEGFGSLFTAAESRPMVASWMIGGSPESWAFALKNGQEAFTATGISSTKRAKAAPATVIASGAQYVFLGSPSGRA
jgi:hypothetical protein